MGTAANGARSSTAIPASSDWRTSGWSRATPRLFIRSGSKISGGRGSRGGALRLSRSASMTARGSRTISSMGAAASASRLTNEVLAPFSSRRRTR